MLNTSGFGERLKLSIKDKKYTQKRLSEELQINQDTITNYVKGTIPKADILYLICQLLNVSIEYLLTGKTNESDPVAAADKNHSIIENNKATIELNSDEQKLIQNFRCLDEIDKEIIRHTSSLMIKKLEKNTESNSCQTTNNIDHENLNYNVGS